MELNVVSFNIWCHNQPGKYSIVSRAPRLKEVLKIIDADIIGMQECTPTWLKHLEKDYGKEYEIFNVYRAAHNHESTPILWKKDKFTCLLKGNFWLSDTPEVESEGWCEWKCNRICTWAKLQDKATGKVFLFMNTHFGFGDACQTKSAKLMHEYNLKLGECTTVITGDFNMIPDDIAYGEMTRYYTDVNAVTAKDLRSTYHGYAPEEHPNSHIDYCFVDDKIIPVNQRIIDAIVDGKYPSDHFGLEIDLNIPE
jgi:endonuclease/exonuclease/phosphatase family metal-dependent hydrolase